MTIPANQLRPSYDSLATAVSSYPVFEANQLLSFRDLNDVREYLDQQTRLTRVCLTGAGIVCGLVPRASGGTIEISAGCGVTTEGFLIHLDACTLTHYQEIEVPRGAFLGKDSAPDDVVDVLELFAEASDDRTALSASLIADKVVALLLECHDEKNEACLDDCDEKGTRREFKVRKLLLDRAIALGIALDNYNPRVDGDLRLYTDWDLDDLLIGRYGLADLYLERFGHTPANGETPAQVKLTTIESYDIFLERYGAIIEAGRKRVAEALARAHVAFSPLFSSQVGALPKLPAARFDIAELKGERRLEIQYVYDHLADLIRAYEEFRDVAFDLMDACGAELGWFPKHLLLGAPDGLPIPPSTVRTPYAQPPVYNGNRARADAARLMYQRLQALVESFAVPDPTKEPQVRITPSRWSDAPLSARAIPYYYDPAKKLYRVWNADRHRKARDRHVHGYFRIGTPGDPGTANPPYDDPLVFDLEEHDFYRIEGHIGREKKVALDRIASLRECYNLAFDLVVLKLGKLNEEDFEHDCEFRILQVQYTKLRTDLRCVLLDRDQDQYAELLATLVEKLDDFVYTDFETAFLPVLEKVSAAGENGGTCLWGYDKEPFFELSELHRVRKEEVRSQTLFHEFAKRHPGLEHKAGVPRGGTFVLVYDELPSQATEDERQFFRQIQELPSSPLWAALERRLNVVPLERERQSSERVKELQVSAGSERPSRSDVWAAIQSGVSTADIEKIFADVPRQTVVADFCLPYSCCSDCPPTAYVLEKPRPTLRIEQTEFCADDDGQYDFVVDPPGGEISGPGTHREGFRYYFVPSDAGDEPGDVVVTYTVDGVSRTLTLRILPVPQATFLEVPADVCHGEEPVPLTLASGTPDGGEFTTDIDENNPHVGIVEDDSGFFFDARVVDPEPGGTQVAITYTVTGENECTGTHTQVTTVWPKPNAGFSGLNPGYCENDPPSTLVPNDPNLKSSSFSGVGVEGTTFNPGSIDFEGPSILVTVEHAVSDKHGCSARESSETTVYHRLQGDFKFGDAWQQGDEFIFPIHSIQPKRAGQPYVYVFKWEDRQGLSQLVQDFPDDFDLSIPRAQLEGMEVLKMGLVVMNGPCEGIPSEPVETPIPQGEEPPTNDPHDVLRRRSEEGRGGLAALAAENAGLSPGLLDAAGELLGSDPSGSPDALVEDFGVFVDKIVPGYARLRSDERREAYRSIAKLAAETVLDRVAVNPPDTASREKAAEQLKKLGTVGLDLPALQKEWTRGDMAAALDDSRIRAVVELFA